MTLTQLRTMARAQVPGAKKARISDTTLDLILNNGKDDIASKTKCLPKNKKITVTAEAAEYNLTSFLTRYLLPHESGVYWNNGSEWKRLYPRTREYLDKSFPYWRDDSSSDPVRYFIEGDILTLHPKPDTTLASGLWIYFFQKPPNMTSGAHYPFGGATEISRLVPLQQSLLAYVRWQLGYALNKGLDNYRMGENAYKRDIIERMAEIGRRADISKDSLTKYGGSRVV